MIMYTNEAVNKDGIWTNCQLIQGDAEQTEVQFENETQSYWVQNSDLRTKSMPIAATIAIYIDHENVGQWTGIINTTWSYNKISAHIMCQYDLPNWLRELNGRLLEIEIIKTGTTFGFSK